MLKNIYMRTCIGTTKGGRRCKLPALTGEKYCRHHLPYKNAEGREETFSDKAKTFVYQMFGSTIFQIIFTFLIFVLTFLLTRKGNWLAEYIDIPVNIGLELFSVVAQALAALIGFLFVFIALALQFVGLERSKWFDLFRDKVERINRLIFECPLELLAAQEILLTISEKLEEVTIQEIVVTKEDYEKSFVPLLYRLAELKRIPDLSLQNKAYLQEAFSILISIEEIYRKIFVAYIGSVVLPVDFAIYPKLLILFILSIILIPIFGSIDLRSTFLDLHMPIIISFIIFLVLLLIETYQVITRLFKSLVEWR
jgi:hypothetical protein